LEEVGKDIEILPKMAMLACLENVCIKDIEGIFEWNYKRFKKIEGESDRIIKILK
jgi:hypothetical protein